MAVEITGIQVGTGCPNAMANAIAGLAAPMSVVIFQGITSANQGAIPKNMKEPKIMSRGTPMDRPRPQDTVLNMTVRVRKYNRFNKRTADMAMNNGMERAFPVARKMSR